MWFGFQKTLSLPDKTPKPRAMDGSFVSLNNDSGLDHKNMKLTFGSNDGAPQDGDTPPWSTPAAIALDGFSLPPAASEH
jgi:hypothetical protein